jgi:hypothetical protein
LIAGKTAALGTVAFWNKKKKADADEPPRIGFIWSSNMQLRVAAPTGEAWQTIEATPKPPLLGAFKCVRGAPPDAIALDAYVHEKAPGFDVLKKRDWRAHYENEMFGSIESLSVDGVKHATRDGFTNDALEVSVDGRLRAPDMPIRLRARYVISDGKLLVVNAIASAEQHEKNKNLIDSWLSHASLGG